MKLWKKPKKNKDVVIHQPKPKSVNTLSYPKHTKKQKQTAKTRSRSNSRRSHNSTSSVASGSRGQSQGENESDFGLDSDYTDHTISDDNETVGELSRRSSRANFGKNLPRSKKKKKKPIVNSCCGFCSLGAGSLITGIFFMCFGIGFLVFRINDFNSHIGKAKMVYSGIDYYKDLWKIILISGMAASGISMLGALVLLIASCIFGQKEHYRKMRIAVIIWSSLTALSVLWNIGEGVFVILMPSKYYVDPIYPFKYDKIKAQLPTVWALAGLYALFYIYLVIVLVSYLRQLKYQGAPKVGGSDFAEEIKNNSAMSRLNSFTSTRSRADRASIAGSVSSRHADNRSNKNVSALIGSRTASQLSSNGINFASDGNAYMNWSQVQNLAVPSQQSENNSSSTYDVPISTKQSKASTEGESNQFTPVENFSDEAIIATNEISKFEASPTTGNLQNTTSDESRTESVCNRNSPDLSRDFNNDPNKSRIEDSTYLSPSSQSVKSSALSLKQKSNSSATEKTGSKLSSESDNSEKIVEPAVVSRFFKKLSNDTTTNNPVEEMFRLFGGDLCSQHPENCERYLKSYKDVRSKSSHLSSLRDPYEFEKLNGLSSNRISQSQKSFSDNKHENVWTKNNSNGHLKSGHNAEQVFPIQRIPMSGETDSLQSSVYNHSPERFIQPPSRHLSHLSFAPEPIYDFHMHSRTSRNSHHQSDLAFRGNTHQLPLEHQRTSSNRYPPYNDRHPNDAYSFNYEYDPYYDESCSTCYGDYIYGDYIYGDYSDCYSSYDYYPPPKQSYRSTQMYPPYDPMSWSPNPTHNPSGSQFSTMPHQKNKFSQNTSVSSWIPIDAEDNYSMDRSHREFSLSEKSLSLPNLADRTRSAIRPPKQNSRELFATLSPEFTLPSPRESKKLSRTSMLSDSKYRNKSNLEDPRDSGFRGNSRPSSSFTMPRNYSGYHTGDLRTRTSHTFPDENDSWFPSTSEPERNISIQSSRSSRPISSRHDERSDHFSERTKSRSSIMSRSKRDLPLSPTHSSDSIFRLSSRPQTFVSSEFSYPSEKNSKIYNPYPDKHILSEPFSASTNNLQSSLDGSRAIVPYNSSSLKAEQKKTNTLSRTRSARYDQRLSRTSSKQVKFGSTPDLHRI